MKPKKETNKKGKNKDNNISNNENILEIELKPLIYVQSWVRGFLLRKNLKLSKFSQQTFEDNQLNNITNNNISNNIDIISQSTITGKKENVFTNNLEKNITIMNFNPNISKSIEYKNEIIIDNQYLNINLVSNYIIYYTIIFNIKIYNFCLANYRIKKNTSNI